LKGFPYDHKNHFAHHDGDSVRSTLGRLHLIHNWWSLDLDEWERKRNTSAGVRADCVTAVDG
jgi:hypothetical protein